MAVFHSSQVLFVKRNLNVNGKKPASQIRSRETNKRGLSYDANLNQYPGGLFVLSSDIKCQLRTKLII